MTIGRRGRRIRRFRNHVLLTSILMVATPATAFAATAATDDPPANAGPGSDILVTGKRDKQPTPTDTQTGAFRNQALVDTPLTVTVIDHLLLQEQDARGLDDALRNVAGITQQGNSPLTANSYAARGVVANPRTNFRLNGALPIINYLPIPIENKERVEALNGVSALYYGFTSPSVIVNLVTKRAGRDPVTDVRLDTDIEGTYGAGVDIGRSFGSAAQFGLRVNGYAAHLETPIDGVHGYRWLTSAAFDVRPTDRLSLQFDVEHYERKMAEPGSVLLPNPVGAVKGIGGTITLPPYPNPHNRYAPTDAAYFGRVTNGLARLDYKIADGWSVDVEGGVARLHRSRWIVDVNPTDLVSGAATLVGYVSPSEDFGNDSVRAEVTGTITTGIVRQEILAGYAANHLRESAIATSSFTGASNFYHPPAVPTSALTFTPKSAAFVQYTDDNGFYLMDTANVGKLLTLIGGARQSSFRVEKVGTTPFRLDKLSPMAAVLLHPVAHTSLYASYVEGLESAGTAPLTAANAGAVLPPLVSRQKELGFKIEDTGAVASIAYFDIDRPSSYVDATNVFVSDGRARFRGVEASFQGTIVPDLTGALSWQFLDAKQVKTSVPAQNGRHFINAPRYAGSLFLAYRPHWLSGAEVNGGVYYTGSRSDDLQDRVFLPGYATVSMGAAYHLKAFDGHAMTIRVTADNLLDKVYWATGGETHLYVGTPRTVRLSLATAF
ncbi:MAG: TonB-dependent siderophore receptor [Sphingomonas sp.]|uniref:TonB-dependent siderophore receptor n=1 Tax=Sphingomonas sp. TaxID=28214 RepID=UPI001AD3DF2D|nr:TonB-dependent siderophore receptor [Sphingomonas sp.]MBN8809356.1 TonB-dependent siderophore receptor [Sphingomonas sp.]